MSKFITAAAPSTEPLRVGDGETAIEFFRRRAEGRTGEGLSRLLDKAPDRPPDPGDELPEGWKPDWLEENA